MNIFKNFKYNKIKKQNRDWVLRYALVALIIMMISFFGQAISSSILKKETQLANRNVVKQTGILCDELISDMENAANRLIVSSDVRSIYKKYLATPGDITNSVKNIISEQASIVNANRIIKNSMVVFAESDMCITQEASCTKDVMYHMAFEDYYDSTRECLDDIFINEALEFKYLKSKNGKGTLFYIYSFIYGSPEEIKSPAVVVFELDFQNAVGISAKNEIGDFFVTDSEGKIAFVTGLPNGVSLECFDMSTLRFDKGDYILNSYDSQIAPVRYYHIIEKSAYMKNVNTINTITFICSILCLLIGGVMAYAFGKRDYLFVNRILDKMYIDEKTFNAERGRMEEFYLQNYLTGNITADKAFAQNRLRSFEHSSFALVLIDICDFGIYKDDEHDMALFCIRNVFTDVAEDYSSNIYCSIDGTFVCLMNFDYDKDGIHKVNQQLEFVAEFLNMHFGMELNSVLSDVSTDIKKLPALFEQARSTLFADMSSADDVGEELADERIAAICRFVDANYSDGNLSVQSIAEHFGLSLNYISKYFKQQQGEGLAKYIILKRMSAAKTLLINTNYSIAKIASETGFFSSNVFIRSFKKVEGITPGQYRKENSK